MGLKADEESVWLNIRNSFNEFHIIINEIQNKIAALLGWVMVHIVSEFQAWLEKIILDNFLLSS